MPTNVSSNLEESLSEKIFDLALGRLFKTIHSGFGEEDRVDMDRIFSSGTKEEKEDFIKNKIPNLEEIFSNELVKLGQEVFEEVAI